MVWNNLHEFGILISWALFFLIGASFLYSSMPLWCPHHLSLCGWHCHHRKQPYPHTRSHLSPLTLNLLWKILETDHFLRFQAHQIGTCLHLYQTKYIKNLLIQTSMQASKPLSTPISSSLPFLFMIGSYYLILLSIEVLLEHSNIAVLLDLTYAL